MRGSTTSACNINTCLFFPLKYSDLILRRASFEFPHELLNIGDMWIPTALKYTSNILDRVTTLAILPLSVCIQGKLKSLSCVAAVALAD